MTTQSTPSQWNAQPLVYHAGESLVSDRFNISFYIVGGINSFGADQLNYGELRTHVALSHVPPIDSGGTQPLIVDGRYLHASSYTRL